jgi:hypothetical protein
MVVRSGISLDGAGAATTIIEGKGALDHTTSGGALSYANLFATVLLGDAAQPTNLSNLTVRAPSPVPVASYYGVLCDRGNAATTITNPPATSPAPNATLSGVTVGPGFDYGIAVTNSSLPAASACNLKLTASTVKGNNNGIWVVGCGTGAGPAGIVAAQIGGAGSEGNQIIDNSGYGLIVWDCSSPVRITGNVFDNDSVGVALAQHPRIDASIPVPGYLTADGNTFRNLTSTGIVMGASVILERLLSNTFTNITNPNGTAMAIVVDSNSAPGPNYYRPQIKLARSNNFLGNDGAIELRGTTPIANDPDGLDTNFGTVGDPGNNVFRCNAPLTGSGYDIEVFSGNAGGSLRFAGNQWDSAPPRVALVGSAVNGTELVFSGPTPSPTPILDNATVSTAACPAGRSP